MPLKRTESLSAHRRQRLRYRVNGASWPPYTVSGDAWDSRHSIGIPRRSSVIELDPSQRQERRIVQSQCDLRDPLP